MFISLSSMHDFGVKMPKFYALWGDATKQTTIVLFLNSKTVLRNSTRESSLTFDKVSELE